VDAGFKKCCMRGGAHDGSNRHDYFQGVMVGGGPTQIHPKVRGGFACIPPERMNSPLENRDVRLRGRVRRPPAAVAGGLGTSRWSLVSAQADSVKL
jgi:hypothetical protein